MLIAVYPARPGIWNTFIGICGDCCKFWPALPIDMLVRMGDACGCCCRKMVFFVSDCGC